MSYITGCERVVMLINSILNMSLSCLLSVPFISINVYIAHSFFFGFQKKNYALSNAVCGSWCLFCVLIFLSPCIVIYSCSTTNKIHLLSQIIYSCKTLYVFRTVFPSIIRRSNKVLDTIFYSIKRH